jgi:hypothetical protein
MPERQRPRDVQTRSEGRPSVPGGRDEPPARPVAEVLEFAPPVRVEQPASAPAPAAPAREVVVRQPLPESVLNDYRAIVDHVRPARPELAAFLEHASPLKLTPEEIVLGWEPKSMFASQASDKESLAVISRAAQTHFGQSPRITCEFDSERALQTQTLALLESAAREQKTRAAIQAAREHPRIADAVEILGARLKDVKLAEG